GDRGLVVKLASLHGMVNDLDPPSFPWLIHFDCHDSNPPIGIVQAMLQQIPFSRRDELRLFTQIHASSGVPIWPPRRVFTATKTSVSPSHATISISPEAQC